MIEIKYGLVITTCLKVYDRGIVDIYLNPPQRSPNMSSFLLDWIVLVLNISCENWFCGVLLGAFHTSLVLNKLDCCG